MSQEQLIPKKIYQSWKTKTLDSKMTGMVEKIKKLNPEYEYELFDDTECREFLLKNFGKNYANAFDALVPGAFKCDFWRYAMLYVNGGVYMDIDMELFVPFSEIIEPQNTFVSIVDRSYIGVHQVHQAFVACVPKHPILLLSLQISFANIVTRRSCLYDDALTITGPAVMNVAVNLFWEKENPGVYISPGLYDEGRTKFLAMEYPLVTDGKKVLINTKFDGYKGDGYSMKKYYHDDPYYARRKLMIYGLFGFIVLAVVGLLLFLFYRNKYKVCSQSIE